MVNKKRKRMDVDLRKQMLLELGRGYFGRHTYDEISIEDLAREAGISKGLLYHYFPTKREFYIEVIRAATTQMLKLTDIGRDQPPLSRLSLGLDAYLTFAEENALSYTSLLRSGVGVDPEVVALVDASRAEVIARILETLDLDKVPGRLRLVLRGWVGFTEAVTLEWLERKDVPREEVRKLLMHQLGLTLTGVGLAPSLARLLVGRVRRKK